MKVYEIFVIFSNMIMIEMVEQTLEFDIYCHLKIRKKSGLRNIGLRQQRIVFNKRKKM